MYWLCMNAHVMLFVQGQRQTMLSENPSHAAKRKASFIWNRLPNSNITPVDVSNFERMTGCVYSLQDSSDKKHNLSLFDTEKNYENNSSELTILYPSTAETCPAQCVIEWSV